MKRLDSGAANPVLNRNFLHGEIVSWPEADEQRGIVAILDAIDCKIDLHRKKRAVLDELFKALLHKLMTGEIRVADLDLSALAVPGSAGSLPAASDRLHGSTIARTPSRVGNVAPVAGEPSCP
jgi:type I restriction enzyme S subunit